MAKLRQLKWQCACDIGEPAGLRIGDRFGGDHEQIQRLLCHGRPSRMLKKSLPGAVKRGSAAELRPCPRNGAALGEEAVLADSGRAGEIAAGVGRV